MPDNYLPTNRHDYVHDAAVDAALGIAAPGAIGAAALWVGVWVFGLTPETIVEVRSLSGWTQAGIAVLFLAGLGAAMLALIGAVAVAAGLGGGMLVLIAHGALAVGALGWVETSMQLRDAPAKAWVVGQATQCEQKGIDEAAARKASDRGPAVLRLRQWQDIAAMCARHERAATAALGTPKQDQKGPVSVWRQRPAPEPAPRLPASDRRIFK